MATALFAGFRDSMPRPRKKKTSKGAVAASAAAGTADEDTKGGGSKEQVAKTVAALVQHAEELLSMSDVEDAIETLQHALLLDPSNLGERRHGRARVLA